MTCANAARYQPKQLCQQGRSGAFGGSELSVHARPEGRYQVLWRSPAHTRRCKPGCAKRVHQHGRTFDSEPEAARFDDRMLMLAAEQEALGLPGTVGVLPDRLPGSPRSFRQVALDVIERRGKSGQWASGTCAAMRSALRKLGALADRPVTEVASDLRGAEDLVAALARPAHAISLLKRTCDYAATTGEVSAHSMAGLEARERRPATERRFVFATDPQLEVVSQALDAWRPGLGLALQLMRHCGLRTGEALGVGGSDFQKDFSILRVSRQVNVNGQATALKSKRASAYRYVPVPRALAARIRQHVAEHGPGRPLFLGSRGGYTGRTPFNAVCRDAATAAGLSAGWVPYMCRHHYASELVSRGVSIDRVSKLLGHSSIQQTYSAYSHWLPDEFDDIRAVLDSAG